MNYYFGIAIKELSIKKYVVLALAIPAETAIPIINTNNYNCIKKYVDSIAITQGTDITKTINAVSHRLIEKLLIKEKITLNTNINAKLILDFKYSELNTIFPIRNKTISWIIKIANSALHYWLHNKKRKK